MTANEAHKDISSIISRKKFVYLYSCGLCLVFEMLHRGCSHVLEKKHASGATDKLPVLTESARTHQDACVHEKQTVRKLK